MRVPLLNLVRQHELMQPRLLAAITQVVDSGRFILGPRVEEFEQQVAAYVGAAHAVGVASGTDALQLALRALDIGPGHAVITTPYTFVASAEAISLVGARPLFVDVEPDTYNLDPVRLTEFCTRDCMPVNGGLRHQATGLPVKAIMPVHLFGQCTEMTTVLAVAGRYGLSLVEDAAQSLGAQQFIRGRWVSAGALGTVGCYSFFPSKNLSALGDGGMVVTSDRRLFDRLQMLRGHGAKPKHFHHFIGLNSRLDELQAAVLLVKFEFLAELNRKRAANSEYYTSQLSGVVQTPVVRTGNRSVFNQYVIRTPQRDQLMSFLNEREVATEIYYPLPLHLQECYRDLGYRAVDFPVAEQASRETLALPIDPMLTKEELACVAESVRAFFQ